MVVDRCPEPANGYLVNECQDSNTWHAKPSDFHIRDILLIFLECPKSTQ